MAAKHGMMMLVLALILSALTAYAQLGSRPPEFRGVWKPVVGSGAVYHVEGKGQQKTEIEIAVVGTETWEAKPGYWLELAAKGPDGGPTYIKSLVVMDGKQTQVKRMMMQAPGQPPMEFPAEMMRRGAESADMREQAERVGSETITTPAGSFACEHWRMKDGSADIWYTEKVAPYGLVKFTGKDTSMTLLRLVSGAKTRLTGTPQKFDPMEMMRRTQKP